MQIAIIKHWVDINGQNEKFWEVGLPERASSKPDLTLSHIARVEYPWYLL